MDSRFKTLALAITGVFCIGILCAYALQQRAGVRFGPTRAYAEPPTPIHGAAVKVVPADWDPLAEDRALAQPKAAGQVKLTAKLDRQAVLVNSDGVVQVQLNLSAPEPSARDVARRATDVLVVLDISGSMEGQKLAYAKRALHQLIARIEPRHRFGLVVYESGARVVVPLQAATEQASRRWHREVDALVAAGGTNMSSGLDLGLGELAGSASRSHMARVLLLSDGHANEGDSSLDGLQSRARRIVRSEHVLTTMGIGDDFNEDLMTSLAEQGAGNFYYLSRVDTIGHFFDAELRASTQTVASALELRFIADPGTELLDVSGYPIERDSDVLRVRPGNLFAGQKRTLWATLKVSTERLGKHGLGRFSLAYKQGDASQLVAADALPALECVAERERFEKSVRRDVWEEGVIKNQLSQSRMKLGKAIGGGTAKDVDDVVQVYEANRQLAESLGSGNVLGSLSDMHREADKAKAAQAAPTEQRGVSAKRAKATALYDLRGDAYKDDPLMGLSN